MIRSARWIQKHWKIIGPWVSDADRRIWEINGFLLIFYPFANLIDHFQTNTASASAIAPLLFQCFSCYRDTVESHPFYFQMGYWREALSVATSALWQRTLAGPQRDFILASYAVTPAGAAMLAKSFFLSCLFVFNFFC
jgi:hypothetical protein